ncbi:MAG: DUF2141 domain-containing protein [Flavobacteriaceae bacterium]|nr:DUF2141 domain-containing protein [Flavobacteriaceae bacterium]
MKNSILMLLVFLHGSLILNAQNTIEVKIINFASDKGVAQIGLFNKETSFLDKFYKGKEVKIKDQKAVAIFTDIPDGTYAISVFHDKNEDEKLNTFLGIPTENYAASNNAPSKFGPPKWKDAKFEVRNGEIVKQKISL